MKKNMLVMLMTLSVFTATALPVGARGQLPPNYPAAHDGYAPADYDGDGKVDWAIKDFSGAWAIDYAANGFGSYDAVYYGYGGQNNIPVPGDYDGDGKADLAVKSNDTGEWLIDYASNGFGTWDAVYYGYGGAENIPVPADYDGDGKTDLAVKSNTLGTWNIDYASNGFGTWDATYYGYGGAENVPVPADYDGDGKADFGIWISSGTWAGTFDVDYAFNGFGTWDVSLRRLFPGPGRPAAGDFNGDCYADFSVKRDDGSWSIAYAGNTCGFPCVFGCGGMAGVTIATYYGYGDSLNRPVPANYDGDEFTDLAIRAEVDPSSFAIDYGFNGFGSYDAVYHP